MHPVIQVAPARSDASIPIPIRVLQEEQSKSKPRSHGKRLERETFLLEPCQPETAPLQPYRPFRLLHELVTWRSSPSFQESHGPWSREPSCSAPRGAPLCILQHP